MSIEATVDAYCACWTEMPLREREACLTELLAPDVVYTDPSVETRGLAELAAHIARVVAERPGSRVLRTTSIDVHHGIARFGWCLEKADGTRLPAGLDVVWTDEAGRLSRILGFFGPLRPL